jgi:hypothetical protein
MAGMGKWKLGMGIGCGVLVLVVVGILGVTTFYASRVNKEYKDVADSESALLAATGGDVEFRPPVGGIPGPDRIEVFLAVREELNSWRRTMATASGQFAMDRERQKDGGFKDLIKLIFTGSDLMPIYAGFWIARNESLLAHEMGPGEYTYIYELAYRTWLNLDRSEVSKTKYPDAALTAALAPYEERMRATFDPDVNLVELIFQKDKP